VNPTDTWLPDDADVRASVTARLLQTLLQTSSKQHVAILNPNYKPGIGVLVLANCVCDAEQELLRLVEDLKKAGAKFKTTAAHGDSLQQFWLGF
jgi:hypothetical protein